MEYGLADDMEYQPVRRGWIYLTAGAYNSRNRLRVSSPAVGPARTTRTAPRPPW